MPSNHSHSHSFVRLSNLFMENSSNSKPNMEDNESTTTADQLDELPGFRFHPTEEELLEFYLKNILLGKKLHYDIIGFLNIYHHDPWELPGLAKIGEREWYFFVPRDRKHGNGGRPNRTTKTGFWKATGSDRKILSLSNPKKMIGLKKTLVFYKGRAPRGCKTDWIMNEYRHPDTSNFKDVVLCKIYRKATSLRVLEQRAAIEEEEAAAAKAFHIADTNTTTKTNCEYPSSASPPTDSVSSCSTHVGDDFALSSINHAVLKKEAEELLGLIGNELQVFDNNNNNKGFSSRTISSSSSSFSSSSSSSGSGDLLQKGKLNLGELQVPAKYDNMEWIQDPLWTQLRSPWLDNILTPGLSYANLLNF